MTRILPALLLLGCGDPAVNFWRRTLDACGQITLMLKAHPTDGGSICFFFKIDAGDQFMLQAVHQDVAMGGNERYQEFRILGDSYKAEVEPGSALESRLAVLLEACLFKDPSKWGPDTRDWLLGRLRNRDIPWGPCP